MHFLFSFLFGMIIVCDHIQYYVNPNDTEARAPPSEEEKEELGLSREIPEVNIGAPVITVLTQADTLKALYAAETLANRSFDILTQYVRLWSLKYGGASFSMAAGLATQARRILSYIQHRVFDSKFIHGPSAVVSITNLKEEFLFIPSGYDSRSIIESQAGERDIDEDFSTHFKSKSDEKEVRGVFCCLLCLLALVLLVQCIKNWWLILIFQNFIDCLFFRLCRIFFVLLKAGLTEYI